MKKTIIKARCISPGVAEGEALVSKSRISFWGGADVMKGIFTERGHELQISYGCRAGGGCVLHHQNRGLGQG